MQIAILQIERRIFRSNKASIVRPRSSLPTRLRDNVPDLRRFYFLPISNASNDFAIKLKIQIMFMQCRFGSPFPISLPAGWRARTIVIKYEFENVLRIHSRHTTENKTDSHTMIQSWTTKEHPWRSRHTIHSCWQNCLNEITYEKWNTKRTTGGW